MAKVASTEKNIVAAVNGYHRNGNNSGIQTLRLYQLQDDHYVEMSNYWMPEVELGLMVWTGEHQGVYGEWLRWCDQAGVPIPTGQERAQQEQRRAERLAAKLRALGMSDDDTMG